MSYGTWTISSKRCFRRYGKPRWACHMTQPTAMALQGKGLAPEIPEDLYFMIKKAVSMRKVRGADSRVFSPGRRLAHKGWVGNPVAAAAWMAAPALVGRASMMLFQKRKCKTEL